jgi:hypothetical protein
MGSTVTQLVCIKLTVRTWRTMLVAYAYAYHSTHSPTRRTPHDLS